MSEFKIFHYDIKTKKQSISEKGLTLVLLADLHNKLYGPDNEGLLREIAAQKPDAVLAAGDMLVAQPGQSFAPALKLFQGLKQLGLPVFYGNGNHEYRMRIYPEHYGSMYAEYTGELLRLGVKLLENERAVLETTDSRVVIHGFELDRRYYKKFVREKFDGRELTKALGQPDTKEYNILLAHNPVYFDAYASWGADLTLSGHLHGGIIRIPGIGGVITPQAKLFPRYDAGHFEKNGRDLIVSRGLGTHTVNIRIFNPAELSVIHLKRRE